MSHPVRQRLTRARLASAIVAAVLAPLLRPAAATAQEPGWSEPVSLGRYWFPDVAADTQGRAHIAWSSGADGYDTVMYSIWTPDHPPASRSST